MAPNKKSIASTSTSKAKASYSDFSRTRGAGTSAKGKGKKLVHVSSESEEEVISDVKKHYDLEDDFDWSSKFARFYRAYATRETWHQGKGFIHTKGLNDLDHTLRLWDEDTIYGPSIGLSRMERWERAEELGLNPPEEVCGFSRL
ncbi:hypothetical protein BT69DRAFT_661614 [Atractiella rhizophila]|nr:hypothetical protein BT69DRAFT_661614 [Atractiella rhizophila]